MFTKGTSHHILSFVVGIHAALCTRIGLRVQTVLKVLLWAVLSCFPFSYGFAQNSANGSSWWNGKGGDDSNANREFYVTFMRNNGRTVTDTKDVFLNLYATSKQDTKVTVTGWETQAGDMLGGKPWTQTYTVNKDQMIRIPIPLNVGYLEGVDRRTNKEWLHKGLIVTADNPITLYASNSNLNSYDASKIYPREALNREYVIQTFSADRSGNEFAIVSTANNNKITINVQETQSGQVTIQQQITLTLQRGETYLYKAQGEATVTSISGTSICADFPIAVYQGGENSAIPQDNTRGPFSHIYTQTPPTDSWGKNYVVTRTEGQKKDYVLFTAAEDATELYQNGTLIATLNKQQTQEILLEWPVAGREAVSFYASKAVMCCLYQIGNYDTNGVPTVTDITPIEQGVNEALCGTFRYCLNATMEEEIKHHFVNIVVPDVVTGSMRLDGNSIPNWKTILLNGKIYAYTTVDVAGKTSFVLSNTSAPFVAHVYGRDELGNVGAISYSYSAGRKPQHSMNIIIPDGEQDSIVSQKTVCQNSSLLLFKSDIDFDYDSIKWEFQPTPKKGGKLKDGVVTYPKKGEEGYSEKGSLRMTKDYENSNVVEDIVKMIVSRKTPICEQIINDTVMVQIFVRDTFATEVSYRNKDGNETVLLTDGPPEYREQWVQENCNICYGEEFTILSGDKEYPFMADTTKAQPLLQQLVPEYGVMFQCNRDYQFVDSLQSVTGCDSIVIRHVIIRRDYKSPTPIDTAVTICSRDLPFQWKKNDGTIIKTINVTDQQKETLKTEKVVINHPDTTLQTIYGCDSTTVALTLTVYPSVEKKTTDSIICVCDTFEFKWRDSTLVQWRNAGKLIVDTKAETWIIRDTLQDEGYQYGCGTVYELKLKLYAPIYKGTTKPFCGNDTLKTYAGKDVTKASFNGKDILYFNDTCRSKMPHGCDSIIVADTLVLFESKMIEVDTTICPSELATLFKDSDYPKFRKLDSLVHITVGQFTDTVIMDTISTIPVTKQTATTKVTSVCDSITTLKLHVKPRTEFRVDPIRVCTCDSTYFVYGTHQDTARFSDAVQQTDYLYYDTIQSINMYDCDSIVIWNIQFIPTDTIDSVITQNQRLDWCEYKLRGNHYGGKVSYVLGQTQDSHRDWLTYDTLATQDSILSAGVYGFEKRYITPTKIHMGQRDTTLTMCDSVYYLRLRVIPTYDIIEDISVCDRTDTLAYPLQDTHGTDSLVKIPIMPIPDKPLDADGNFVGREGEFYPEKFRHLGEDYFRYPLKAVDGGDSIIYLHITVHPSYYDTISENICVGNPQYDHYDWRGASYTTTGIYTRKYQTVWGCDSIYALDLFVKNISIHTHRLSICNNKCLIDSTRRANGQLELKQLWCPGENIPSPTDTITLEKYRDTHPKDSCDKEVHYYLITAVNPAYNDVFDAGAVCSGDEEYSAHGHTWSHMAHFYEPGLSIAPFDTVYVDSLQTSCGCDSIFRLSATVYPSFKHTDSVAVCQGDPVLWFFNQQVYSPSQDTVITANLGTGKTVYGCDSVYELIIHVVVPEDISLCTNDTLDFYGRPLHLPVGSYRMDTTFTTASGIDTLVCWMVTVKDTTFEVLTDTICRSETYNLHGRLLSEAGFYKDTTLNDDGCHHFTYLNLNVVDPTVPVLWMPHSLCVDSTYGELYFTYTNSEQYAHRPFAYSVHYDSLALSQGLLPRDSVLFFEDDWIGRDTGIVRIPLFAPDSARDRYPRPDTYMVTIILHNGICRNDDSLCAAVTPVSLSYPSWIIEQRFDDVIAVLSAQYNGGYEFDAYQWYRNSEPMIGETRPYLYLPQGLEVGTTEYSVSLTRTGESAAYQTCPILIVPNAPNTVAPNYAYLSVVPTYVDKGNPVVHILCREVGDYAIYNALGVLLTSGTFTPDDHNAYEVTLPAESGMYIFKLHSPATVKETDRTVRVIVGN